jgi:hypothetical protein
MTDAEKLQLDALNEERKTKGETALDKLPESTEPPAKTAVVEITDDLILARFNEKNGTDYKSFDELKPKAAPIVLTPEEIEAKKEERENKKIAWAITNGKVSEKKLKAYSVDSNDPSKLVYAEFVAKKKEENPDMSDEDIDSAFESAEEYMGKDVIKKMGESILRNKYSEIFGIDKDFSSFEEQETSKLSFISKKEKEAPMFVKANTDAIDKYVNDGIEFEITLAEGQPPVKLKVDVDKAKVDAVKNYFTSDERVENAIKNGYKSEDVDVLIKNTLITANINEVVKQVYQQAMTDKEAIKRGIPPLNGNDRKNFNADLDVERVNENLKKAREKGIPV